MTRGIERLYDAHARALQRALASFGHEVREEACAQTWLIACQHTSTLLGHPNPRGWLVLVAKREALRVLRHEKRERATWQADLPATAGDPFEHAVLDETLARLGRLSANRRRAVAAAAVGCRLDEIAAAGAPRYRGRLTWASRHIYEGRRALRAEMGAT